MATELSREELRQLARLGAERRLEELRQEEAALRAAFPDLDDGGARGRRGRSRPGRAAANPAMPETAARASASPARKRRRRKPMSPAQKRAVSERMKKYWAARRKANG